MRMKNIFLKTVTVLLLCWCMEALPTAHAQENTLYTERSTDPSLITRATLYGVGVAGLLDTYLSPLSYRGMEIRIARESVHASSWSPELWSVQTFFQGYADYLHNRAGNNHTVAGMANWNYGLHRRVWENGRFQVLAGGVADLNGGIVYNMRNGNNPVNARVHADIDASVRLLWQTRIGNFPLLFRYQANVPLLGLMFSPHYGQSYFEIFSVGNGSGVVKLTTPFSRPTLRNMLSADFKVRQTTLRLSYVCDLQQADVNGIKSHLYSNVLMIGFVRHLKKL